MSHLKEGDQAPAFTGMNENGEKVSLSDFRGKKLILFFYPKDNTPGCTAEACSLRDHYQELKDQGFALLGVSPDSAKKHQNFISKFELPFPLLADTEQEVLKLYGAWGEKQMYGKTYEGVLRTTFVINEEGVIEKIFRKVKTKNHAEQILAEMQANTWKSTHRTRQNMNHILPGSQEISQTGQNRQSTIFNLPSPILTVPAAAD